MLNIDSKLPNIALKKIEMWHQQRGDEVIWDLWWALGQVEQAYASCIFSKNKWRIHTAKRTWGDHIMAGGTGYDPTIKLPREIEEMKPRLNIGFTTRGCIRNCPFCLVPEAEGYIHVVGDIGDIWDRKSRSVTLLDNNILALPKHFEKICGQLIDWDLAVDFNQGLDIRLLTDKVCVYLQAIKLKNELRFAFDFPELEPIIRQKVALIRKYNIRQHPFFYVLVGFNTTFEEDIHRLMVLKELDCRAYVMRHENTPKERHYLRLAQWANQFWTFAKYNYDEFCEAYEKDKREHPYKQKLPSIERLRK